MTVRRVVLVGHPNAGKSTLFNALTGAHQKVGNWSGVTVEARTGRCHPPHDDIELTDCPGVDALTHPSMPLDVQATLDLLWSHPWDAVINVVDARFLERGLYLTQQLQALQRPMLLVLTHGHTDALDVKGLERHLGLPVLENESPTESYLLALEQLLQQPLPQVTVPPPDELMVAQQAIVPHAQHPWISASAQALWCLEGDTIARAHLSPEGQQILASWQQRLQTEGVEPDLLMASQRYERAHTVAQAVGSSLMAPKWTHRLDRWALHPFWGLLLFLIIMYTVFFCTMAVGGLLQQLVVACSEWGLSYGQLGLQRLMAPDWLSWLLIQGLGQGMVTMLGFIPVLAMLFFCLGALEHSGYFTRAACVLDKVMRRLNLPGQAFIPLVVGLGCNVPAVMATRTLSQWQDRVVTALMVPFMSCGARLTVYAVFAAAFFPQWGHILIFGLYVLGMVCALLTAMWLRRAGVTSTDTPLVLELSPYQRLSGSLLSRLVMDRIGQFLWRVGRYVLPVCVCLAAFQWSMIDADGVAATWLTGLTTLFYPMGMTDDNWPAVVALFTGALAKEAVVGTLQTLYHLDVASSVQPTGMMMLELLKDGLWQLPRQFFQPWTLSMGDHHPMLMQGLAAGFGHPTAAVSYLIFIALYMPCVSTMSAIAEETSASWMWLSLLWSCFLAYGLAVLFYQLMSCSDQFMMSVWWWSVALCLMGLLWRWLHRCQRRTSLSGGC